MSMERFYARRLLEIAHKHLRHFRIARRFLYLGWEKVNANLIQKSTVNNEFFMPSTQDTGLFYIVNSEIGVCTCFMEYLVSLQTSGSCCNEVSYFHI